MNVLRVGLVMRWADSSRLQSTTVSVNLMLELTGQVCGV